MRYKLRYLEEGGYGDERVPAALVFGTAIHQALGHFYRQAMDGEPFNLAGLLEAFAAAWQAEAEKQEILFGEKEDFASLLALGQEMLKVFARLAHPLKVVAVEVPFEFKLEHPRTGKEFHIPIKGVIDLIEEDENGTLWVVDHKTASRSYTDDQVAGDLQMLIYAAAVKQLDVVEGREALLRFDVLLKTKTPQFLRYCMRRDDRDRERLFEIVTGIWKAIDAEAFYPRCCLTTRWGSPHEECKRSG